MQLVLQAHHRHHMESPNNKNGKKSLVNVLINDF